MLQAVGRGFRAAILADIGRYRACLEEAEVVHDLSASVGMGSAPGLVSLWWRLTSMAGLGDWDGLAALEPEVRRALAAGAGTNVAYRMNAGLARGAAAGGDADAALARIATAREAIAGYGDSYEIPTVLCELSLAAGDVRRDDLARELAEEAVDTAGRQGADWFLARACLLSAHAHAGTPHGRRPAGGGARPHRAPRPDRALGAARASARRRAADAGPRRRRPRRPRPPPGWRPRPGREVLHDCVTALGDGAPARALLAAAVGEETDVDAETMRILLADADAGRRRGRRAHPRGAGAAPPAGRAHRDLRRPAALPGRRARARRHLRPRQGARAARRPRLRRRPGHPPRPPPRAPLARAHARPRRARPRHHPPRAAAHARAARPAPLGRLPDRPRGGDLPPRPRRARLVGRRRVRPPRAARPRRARSRRPRPDARAPRRSGAATSCPTSPTSRGPRTPAASSSASAWPCSSASPPRSPRWAARPRPSSATGA